LICEQGRASSGGKYGAGPPPKVAAVSDRERSLLATSGKARCGAAGFMSRRGEHLIKRIGFLLAMVLIFGGCSGRLPQETSGRVFLLNSYHEGYGSSDDITAGALSRLAGSNTDTAVFFMDTKRNTTEDHALAKAREALEKIRLFRPDVIISMDDPAAKYVIVPHFSNGPVPVVFCGVNWSADQYGFPTPSVTGMLEVLPVIETLEALRPYFPGGRLCVLSEDTLSEQSNQRAMEPIFQRAGLRTRFVLVKDYETWKKEFIRANQEDDIVFIPTNGAVAGWENEDARAFVRQAIRKPVISCDDFMMPFAVYGLTKVAREQGEWAAETALSILTGKEVSDIPVTRNTRTKAFFNPGLAAAIGFEPKHDFLAACESVY
jgi:ABC-type uncharacterized transport system substrate-binding protein